MKSYLLAMIVVGACAGTVSATEIKHVEESAAADPGSAVFVDLQCPSGYSPDGIRMVGDLYGRFIEVPTGRVARVQVFNPAGQGGSRITGLVRLTCVSD